jgi:hypothetical protein
MLKNGRNPEAFSGNFMGCSCCNSKQTRRVGKKSAKRKEKRQWKKDQNVD